VRCGAVRYGHMALVLRGGSIPPAMFGRKAYGVVWQGGARRGVVWQGRARSGAARYGHMVHGCSGEVRFLPPCLAARLMVWSGVIWQGQAGHGKAWQGPARSGGVR
jgi:hypothetical protein